MWAERGKKWVHQGMGCRSKKQSPVETKFFIFLENSQQREGGMGPLWWWRRCHFCLIRGFFPIFPPALHVGTLEESAQFPETHGGLEHCKVVCCCLEPLWCFAHLLLTSTKWLIRMSMRIQIVVCAHSLVHTHAMVWMKVRGQLSRASSLLPQWWSQVFSLGSKHQHRHHLYLPTLFLALAQLFQFFETFKDHGDCKQCVCEASN